MSPSPRGLLGRPGGRALLLLLPCLAAACASAPVEEPAAQERGKVRALEELPLEYRELWQAWQRDDPDWKELRAEALRDPAKTRFLVENLVRTMLGSYRAARITSQGAKALGPFERSRAELVVLGAPSAPLLAELLGVGASDVGVLARQVLEEIGRPAVEPVLGQLARLEHAQARMRAAELLGHLPHAREREELVRERLAAHLEKDAHWMVRCQVALALGRRGYRDTSTEFHRRALSSALGDEDVEVRRSAARALAQLRDPQAIPALINWLERSWRETDLASMRLAEAALRRLSGRNEPLDIDGWRSWWRENRHTL